MNLSRRLVIALLKLVVVFLLLGLCVWGLALALPIPHSLSEPPPATLTLLDCHGLTIAQFSSGNARVSDPIPLARMGTLLPRLTVALEDHRFASHCGIDFRGAASALLGDLRSGRIVAGGSTITQQLVKMAEGRSERSWSAKIRESLLALKLEHVFSKNHILEEYLNRADYGNRRLGVEAAAQAYFGKPASELDLAEAIYLAGLPQSPSRFNPWRSPGRAFRRYQRSLARLEALRILTAEERQGLAASPPVVARFEPVNLAPHFADAARAAWPALSGRARTTLDLELQAAVTVMLRDHLRSLGRFDVTDAAVVVIDNATGGVRAMVGSPNYAAIQVNGALSPRSCGSTLKPFIYLAAIDRRILTAATILPDTPEAIPDTYRDYDPKDYDHHFLGPVRAREALGNSLNVPAVAALSMLGARRAFDDLAGWGFEFSRGLDEYGAGFILGNAEVRLVDLAGAYSGLARGGLAMRPTFLAATHNPMKRVASPEAVEIIDDILCDDAAREKTFGPNSPLSLGFRVAVKTGTSSGFRDGWAVGCNRDHTVAVWAGNPDGRPMNELLSVRSAAPLWASVMRRLMVADRPLPLPRESDRLVRQDVSSVTGMRPLGNERAVSELFLQGTAPVQFAGASVNRRLTLPPEYEQWCRSPANWLGAVASAGPLSIRSPKPEAVFKIDAAIPASQQMLEFVADGDPATPVRWSVNGRGIAPGRDGKVLWQIAAGRWHVKAVAGSEEVSSTISVEE